MLRFSHVSTLLASVFVIAIAIDAADARGGRGGGGGGRGGAGFSGMHAGNRAHVSHPIAGVGRGIGPSHPIAGVGPGWGGNRPGWGNRPGFGYAGYGWGLAAAGATAAYAYSDCSYYGTCNGYYDNSYQLADSDANAVEACAQRFRTYDRATQTFIAKGGRRVSCP